MKILVINGSPKGSRSVTLQTVLYLEKRFPAHSFRIFHAAGRIRSLERDFSPAAEELRAADLILFSYPVYTFLVPAQLHRFLELWKASGVDVSGKWATQITTSKHFYDMTAHRFIEDSCADLGLPFVRGLSADMEDLLRKKGQQEAENFFHLVLWSVKNGFAAPTPLPVPPAARVVVSPAEEAPKTVQKDVVIVTDCAKEDTQLAAMTARFRAVLPCPSRVVNLRDLGIRGGCLGCFHCASDGQCVYTDGFDRFLRQHIQNADALVYAFTIRDHSMGSLFKTYDDRQFCNGHRTTMAGKPVGYLISGSYSAEENLHTVIEGRCEVGENFLAGVATDETDPDRAIDQMARTLTYALVHSCRPPRNFYGVGGMKIFRDLIYTMRGLMRADHRFYKAHGQYDFPQKQVGKIAGMYLVGAMMASPKLKQKYSGKMNGGMLLPYQRVLKKTNPPRKKH